MRMQKIGVGLLLSVLLVTQLYPLLWLLLYSFKTNEEILSGAFFALPDVMKWSNYSDAYFKGNYVRNLFNSLFVTGSTLTVTLLLSSMVGYAIARFKWRWSKSVLLIFIVGMMIPTQSTLLPLVVLFRKLHVTDTYLSMILPYIAFSLPLAVFILTGFFRTIPHELEESASMDGASVYGVFVRIMVPISIPPIVTVTILTFISIWNEYIMAATFISSPALKTLPFGIYSFVSKYSTNFGAIGAYLVLGAIPVLMVYFTLAEKITKGMIAGAVKG
ncbi:carbohydrate ABC transporter permease [Paenibacillaceae bacterium]|nr:carbohydrate ABC transporter permease [Paenibacillaceae bacterium]